MKITAEMMKKPRFEDMYYQDGHYWGRGNEIVGLRMLAKISLGKPSKSAQKKEKADYEKARKIYTDNIQAGQRFTTPNSSIESKITRVNFEKQTVSWKQCNMTKEQKAKGLKEAAGRWSINSLINMIKHGQIICIQ